MSVLTMYPVQSMRKFVCDRLTAAAQEILGAFEKRVEDYEAELARQRRMLDTVFSPEKKLQRAEIKALLNQQEHGNNNGASRFQPDTVEIKDEHEEISISQQRPQPPQQQEATASKLTPAAGPNTSGDQSQLLRPEKENRANIDPPSNTSNKDAEAGFKDVTSPVSEQPLSQNSGEAETQNDNRGASPTKPTEPISTERSPELATNTEETFDESFLNANYADIFNDIDNNEFALSGMSPEPSLNMSFDDLNATSASITEQTQSEKDNVESPMLTGSAELTQDINTEFTTPPASNESPQTRTCTGDDEILTPEGNCEPEANEIQNDNSVIRRGVEPTQPEENQDWRPAPPTLTVPIPDDEIQDETPATTERAESQDGRQAFSSSNQDAKITTSNESAELIPNKKSRDAGATSTENVEQTSHQKIHDVSLSSSKSTEQASRQGSIKESVTLTDRAQHMSTKKHKDERKTSTSEIKHKLHRQSSRSVTDKTLSSTGVNNASYSTSETMQNQRSDSGKMTPNEGTDQEPNIKPHKEKETSNLSSDSAQNEEQGDLNKALTGDTEMAQCDSKSNSEKTETVPRKTSSDRKKATSHSKSKHISNDGSPMSGRSKKQTTVRKTHNEDAKSKDATSTRRHRDDQGSESPPKRMRKMEGSTSSESNQIKKHDECSKENTTSNQNPDPPRSNTDDSESSDREEKVENPYKCDRCGKVMSNFKNYKFHMKSHTVAKTYKCDTCGKMFRESWDLNKHLVIHSTEKPYKCDVCGNGFNRRYNLDLHVRVHTGEKPYVCKTCGKSFSSCVNMKKHMRIHTGEKPYTCKDCGKEFADSSAFKNHLRVHTGEKPFKCSYCKRKFATRTTLKRHIRTHTGEKPYKCTFCDRNFGHRTDLKGHMRMHTGEKPYKCATCGEEFSTWSKLNKHKRIHSDEAQDSTE
ncbi:hypothetical protein CRENBAI_000547 [Crenichthys baileyi]|uniref:C2H2-type domain-containing protein n=1 Tax=Crenichthys baileyi TaxID=28760 RepID=A0AAV9R453_9TELE